ncbi:MAG: response regulator [Planctomycetes bacterium]|nr:response regulator [Planctomycetota bacterium]
MPTNASASTNQVSRFRVLVADDDAGCRDSIVSLLSTDGFEALSVEGGRAVIDLFRTQVRSREQAGARGSLIQRIHFLVVDYNMPDLTGLDVVRVLRSELSLELPSILVTANFDDQLVRRFLSLGGFAVLPKPVEPVDFREMVRKLVRTRLAAKGLFGRDRTG